MQARTRAGSRVAVGSAGGRVVWQVAVQRRQPRQLLAPRVTRLSTRRNTGSSWLPSAVRASGASSPAVVHPSQRPQPHPHPPQLCRRLRPHRARANAP